MIENENMKALIMAKQNFQNPKSEELIIQGFKKEFRVELGKLMQKNGKAPSVFINEGDHKKVLPYYPNPREIALESRDVRQLMQNMNFLSERLNGS